MKLKNIGIVIGPNLLRPTYVWCMQGKILKTCVQSKPDPEPLSSSHPPTPHAVITPRTTPIPLPTRRCMAPCASPWYSTTSGYSRRKPASCRATSKT